MAPASIKKPRAKAVSGTTVPKSKRAATQAAKAPRKKQARNNLDDSDDDSSDLDTVHRPAKKDKNVLNVK
jgi:hypothetical protein